jgi:UPF0176 protein
MINSHNDNNSSLDKNILKQQLMDEPFARTTISFYRYLHIADATAFRNDLFHQWSKLHCFGRIYVASEGINAQMSVPTDNLVSFLQQLNRVSGLEDMPIKYAVEDDGKSFYKLIIRVKDKIVADGLNDSTFDVTNVGNHLSPLEFHELVDQKDTVVIDMRNHYESEVGHFKGAHCPDVDTFREELDVVINDFADQKDKKVLLYCTGGIRCEKASAWMKHKGFEDVNQLHGGIIDYARQIKAAGIDSKFTGKNFVFDERLGESIDGEVISKCHQCGTSCDTHTNCKNDDCHLLFIQCPDCAEKHEGCCTAECQEIAALPLDIQKDRRKNKERSETIYKSRLRPKLQEIN